ncbi:MAG TPA: hypothetical protein VMV43_00670 [Candidatus Nanopelagicaceae bacterium]|nr:hypothetical protein [Candidatus Nanopelagicaceae bacterium]
MIIKCKDCGIEYSYAQNICHACGDNTFFFGAIFEEERSERKWNCASGAECNEILIEKPELHESIIEVFSDN